MIQVSKDQPKCVIEDAIQINPEFNASTVLKSDKNADKSMFPVSKVQTEFVTEKLKQTNSYDIYKCIDENLIDVLAECDLESTVYGGIGIEMIADGDAGDDAQATSDIASLAVSTEPKQREQGEQQPVNSEFGMY